MSNSIQAVVLAAILLACAHCPASGTVSGMVFDGNSTTVGVPSEVSASLEGATGVTFSVWLRRNPEGLGRRNEIMNLTIDGPRAKAVIGFWADDTIRIGGRTRPDEQFRSAATVEPWTDDSLVHIVGVIDLQRPDIRIYLNGESQALNAEVFGWDARAFPADTGIRSTIGVGGDLRNHFHGEIRDIRVYARALDDEEANRLHVLGQNIIDEEIASLIFHWEGTGAAAAPAAPQQATERPGIPRLEHVEMIRIAGSPQEIGRIRGQIEGEGIRRAVDNYLNKARREDVSMETLQFYAAPGIERTAQIAPHWLDEMRVKAETAGVDHDLYITYVFSNLIFTGRGAGWREMCTELPHECTSYAATGPVTENGGIFWHKTRDNVHSPQRAYMVESSLPGINKYLMAGSMWVNDKGLAMSGDYGGPEPKTPRYRGRMDFARYIMENAADCDDALEILKDFVGRGWYVGGTRVGQRWTIVDRHGRILDVTNSSDVDSLEWQYIEDGGPHITRKSAQRLLDTERPISFLTFHDISRDTLVKSSISGCTVEVHPEYPEYLTMVWVSFPARALPFPLFMGGSKTPRPLHDGTIDHMGRNTDMPFERIRELEEALYIEGKQLQDELYRMIKGGRQAEIAGRIDQWVQEYTKRHADELYLSQ